MKIERDLTVEQVALTEDAKGWQRMVYLRTQDGEDICVEMRLIEHEATPGVDLGLSRGSVCSLKMEWDEE